jgi:hypothetical protein
MNEVRQQYKTLVLESCRIAVEGGVMSQAYEDYVIDHIDEIIDELTDSEFEHLVLHGEILLKDITNDEDYDRQFAWQERVESIVGKDLMDSEREMFNKYRMLLENVRAEYKLKEWDV